MLAFHIANQCENFNSKAIYEDAEKQMKAFKSTGGGRTYNYNKSKQKQEDYEPINRKILDRV